MSKKVRRLPQRVFRRVVGRHPVLRRKFSTPTKQRRDTLGRFSRRPAPPSLPKKKKVIHAKTKTHRQLRKTKPRLLHRRVFRGIPSGRKKAQRRIGAKKQRRVLSVHKTSRRKLRRSAYYRRRIVRKVKRRVIRRHRFTAGAWLTKEDWIAILENKYGEIEEGRSDRPASRLHYIFTRNNFLWHVRRWPPMAASTRYIVLENWFIVENIQENARRTEDGDDEVYYLWVQRRALGTGITLQTLQTQLSQIIKTQTATLNHNEYIHVRAFVGWTAYPLAQWDRVRLGKRKK